MPRSIIPAVLLASPRLASGLSLPDAVARSRRCARSRRRAAATGSSDSAPPSPSSASRACRPRRRVGRLPPSRACRPASTPTARAAARDLPVRSAAAAGRRGSDSVLHRRAGDVRRHGGPGRLPPARARLFARAPRRRAVGLRARPPPAGGAAPLPVLVYSHGSATRGRELLSARGRGRGPVVVALEHTDGTASRAELAAARPSTSARGGSGRAQLGGRAAELAAAARAFGGGGAAALADATALPPGALPPLARGAFVGGHSAGGPSARCSRPRGSAPGLGGARRRARPDLARSGARDELRERGEAAGADACPRVSFTSDEYDAAGVVCGPTYRAARSTETSSTRRSGPRVGGSSRP